MQDTKQGPGSGRSLIWLSAAAVFLVATLYFFNLDRVDVDLPFVRLWSLRFMGLGLLCLCLGLGLKNVYLKTTLFSMVAVFAALGAGEAYLAWMNAKSLGLDADKAAVAPEFFDEVRDSLDLYAEQAANDPSGRGTAIQEAQASGVMVRDAAAARKIFAAQGRTVAPDAITTAMVNQKDPILGYRPVKRAAQVMAVKKSRSGIIYSVIYDLNSDGFRVTPQHPQADEAVVFMGCSLTFGEGLNDEDTYPYKVGELLGDKYQVFNFGVSGYGTHHVVAMIENGYLDEIAKKYKKMHVFYLTIPAHALRNAGKSSWDQDGPDYEMTPNGDVVYKGSFREVRRREGQSRNLLLDKLNEDKNIKALHMALIKKARNLLEAKYHTGLTVLEPFTNEEYLKPLSADHIPLLLLLPNPRPEDTIRGDGHPSAKATTVFADEIVKYIKAEK